MGHKPPTEESQEGFSSPAMEAQAEADVRMAEAGFNDLGAAVFAFQTRPSLDCADDRMIGAIDRISGVETTASGYVDSAATLPAADSEEAMEVADELNEFALDGYMSAADAYCAARCSDRAAFIYREIARVYTGEAYSAWRNEALARLAAVTAEKPGPSVPTVRRRRHPPHT